MKSKKSQKMRLSKYSGRVHVGIWPRSKMVCTCRVQIFPENLVDRNIGTYSDLFRANAEQSHATAIVKKLGALPLALDQAGSYISAMQIPFSRYLVRLESAFAEVTAKKPPTVVWHYRSDTVFTTWEMSFNALSPAAQELLLLLGFFDNQSIPEELLPLDRLSNEFEIGEISPPPHLARRPGLYSNSRSYRLS